MFILTGFDRADMIEISNIETTIIPAENILRYDIELKNTGTEPFESTFDYPGDRYYGIELVVLPHRKLAAKMELVHNSKFIKMVSRGSSSTGRIEPGGVGSFHLEYQMKKGSLPSFVKKEAFDSTLLILDGVRTIKQIPLRQFKESSLLEGICIFCR